MAASTEFLISYWGQEVKRAFVGWYYDSFHGRVGGRQFIALEYRFVRFVEEKFFVIHGAL